MATVGSTPIDAACEVGSATRKERDLPAYVLTFAFAFARDGRTPTGGEETSSDVFTFGTDCGEGNPTTLSEANVRSFLGVA